MSLFRKVYNKCKYHYILFKNDCTLKRSKNILKQYHNKYQGQKCFIIGNGPSLRMDDLLKIKSCVTIASHGIYFAYDKVDWQPNFYTAQDSLLINERYNDISKNCTDSQNIFAVVKNREYPSFSARDLCIELNNESFDEMPKFSTDIDDGFYEGMTVTYFNIQLAVYMGFKEIYLLGVDHFYSGNENDHFSKDDVCTNKPQTDKSTLAYIAARKFADENDIKIYNATRGGHLEAFERVDFDMIQI